MVLFDRGGMTRMDNAKGIRRLLKKGRKRFRIKENLLHYAKEDLKFAEKRFLIECVLKDRCRLPDT